jgi:hypothetical protein
VSTVYTRNPLSIDKCVSHYRLARSKDTSKDEFIEYILGEFKLAYR